MLLLVVNVSVALAATASISGTTLTYVASPGEANVATISLDAGTYDIKDSGATITASFGCTSVSPGEVTCAAAGVSSVNADLGDQDDRFALHGPWSLPGLQCAG